MLGVVSISTIASAKPWGYRYNNLPTEVRFIFHRTPDIKVVIVT